MKILGPIWFILVFAFADASAPRLDSRNLDTPIDPENYHPELLEQAIFEATNRLRVEHKLPSFKADSILKVCATFQAAKMAEKEDLRHTWPYDRRYGDLKKRLKTFGGSFKGYAENIARFYILDVPEGQRIIVKDGQAYIDDKLIGFKSYRKLGNEVVQAWYDSPGHRRNLMSELEFMGIGVSKLVGLKKGLNFDVYLCQNFGIKWKITCSFS